MFRERQKFRPCFYSKPVITHIEMCDGKPVSINEIDVKIPSPETAELSNLLKANVPLNQVNSKVIHPSVVGSDNEEFGDDEYNPKQTNHEVNTNEE